MAWLFVRLKLRLIAGGLRGDIARKTGLIISWSLAVLLGVAGAALFLLVRLAPPDIAAGLGIVIFTFFFLAWVIMPVMAFGVDETLDPANLVVFPLTRRQLATGMFAASITGAWPLASLLVLLGGLAGLARDITGLLLGLVAVPLLFALCITTSRALTTALAGALRSRRGRDVLAAAGLAVIVLFQIPNVVFNQGMGDPEKLLEGGAAAFRWTPPGLAAHAIGADPLTGLTELAVLGGLVVLAWWLWMRALDRALSTADASTQTGSVRRPRLHAPRLLLPGGSMGAVVTKDLKYARRDPRVRVMLFTAVVMAAIILFSTRESGAVAAVIPPSMAGFFLGLQTANSFGIDGRALWMNSVAFSTSQDVRRHLAGRQLAVALFGVPLLAIVAAGAAAFAGMPALALPGFALGLGVLGLSLGLGAITSVLLPYTQPERMSAFSSNAAPGQGALAFGSAVGGLVTVAVLTLPIVIPMAFGLVWVSVLAIPYGLLGAWVGRRVAGRSGPGRFPDILVAVTRSA